MDKIEKDGPGCALWMRLYDDKDELTMFLAFCNEIFITQWSFNRATIKELEQDARK